MYLARTALIGDTFQVELEFINVGFCRKLCKPFQHGKSTASQTKAQYLKLHPDVQTKSTIL